METMKGAVLPGNSTVELRDFEIPKPGFGQVLIKTMASTICGQRYPLHLPGACGKRAGGLYSRVLLQDMNPADRSWKKARDCGGLRKETESLSTIFPAAVSAMTAVKGYYISCKSKYRRAYGWQRDGGMAPYILAEEKDLIPLPEPLTYKDGAQVACGFGTVYEAIEKIGVSGNHTVLVTGLGPVGLAALMLARAMGADKLIGVEMNDYRIRLAKKLGLADLIIKPGDGALEEILETVERCVAERAIDASANDQARQLAVRGTREWGKRSLL